MTKDKVVAFPQPPLDLAEVYLGYVDSEPGIDLRDPRLLAIMDAMSREDAARVQAQLQAEGETKARRARALQGWLRQRVLRRDPNVLREIVPKPKPATLQILQGFVELDGERVAQLLPGLRLSLLDRLTEAFGAIEEDAAYIAELEERLEGAEAAHRESPT
jgi:hypothetical protein